MTPEEISRRAQGFADRIKPAMGDPPPPFKPKLEPTDWMVVITMLCCFYLSLSYHWLMALGWAAAAVFYYLSVVGLQLIAYQRGAIDRLLSAQEISTGNLRAMTEYLEFFSEVVRSMKEEE